MELLTIPAAIDIYYVNADHFPEGVLKAHQDLHARIPFSEDRRYFGLSRPENGSIRYKAAAEKFEAEKLEIDQMQIRAGTYACISVKNYMQDLPAIGKAFEELLKQPKLDPEGYCLEWYTSKSDVLCLVPIK